VGAGFNVAITHQAVIHPTELPGNLPHSQWVNGGFAFMVASSELGWTVENVVSQFLQTPGGRGYVIL